MTEAVETRIDMSPEIFNFLSTVFKDPNIDYSLKMRIRICLDASNSGNSLAYDILSEAHDFYSKFQRGEGSENFVTLPELVKSSRVFIHDVEAPVRSPELIQRLEKLKRRHEQKEYNKMVNNVTSKKLNLCREMGAAVRTTKQQTMSILNFLISIFAAYAFGYVVSQYAFAGYYGGRVIFGIFMAVIVGLADLYFMSRMEI